MKRGLSIGVFFLMLAVASGAAAQDSTGGIRGIVSDNTGGVLVGVTVEASSPARLGNAAVEVTNAQGLYRFDSLPLGVYTVTYTLQGFTTVRRENVRVEVGRSVQVDVQLAVGAVEQAITVTAESPVVDAVHAGVSTSFSKELIENIPSNRTSWFDTVSYAPGVKADLVTGNTANFVMYGTSTDQNSYQVNGVEVFSPSGSIWDFPSPDMAEEVAVVGIGASAEYKGFQGGVVNIVTKSGSNQFRGRAQYIFTNDALVGNNSPEEQFPYYIDYRHDLSFQLGGPIKKDRVWFYAIAPATRNRSSNLGVDPQYAARTRTSKPYAKISARLSSKDNLDFAVDDNFFYSPNAATRTVPFDAQTVEHGHNPVVTARWTRTMGSATLLEVRGGGIYIRDRFDPNSGDFTTSRRNDQITGLSCCNAAQVSRSYQNRTSVDAVVSHNADHFLAGSHDFKFGVQTGHALAISNATRFNNVQFTDLNGAPYQAQYRDPTATGGVIRDVGGFAQDNWTVTGRLTLNLGLRVDRTTASIPEMEAYDNKAEKPIGLTYPGLGTLIRFNDVSPRLGLTYRADKTGKTVAKFSYGRYYGKMSTGLFSTLSPGNTNTDTYRYNAATGKYDILLTSTNPRINFLIDPNLTNQFTDQFFIGVERELVPDFGVNASFVYKRDGNLVRGRDTASVYTPRSIVDTFSGVSQTITVFNRTTPSSAVRNTVTNRDDFDGTYKTFIVQASKRFSNQWQLQASYQWQRSLGWSGSGTGVNSQTGEGTFGSNPNDLINAFGRNATDSTHAIKLNAALQLKWGIHLGVRESFETGRPYGRVITVRGLSQGSFTILAQPRDAYERPSTNDLQVRVEKAVAMGGRRYLRLGLDVFNIFNADTALTVANDSTQTIPFGQTQTIFLPRRANITVRFDF